MMSQAEGPQLRRRRGRPPKARQEQDSAVVDTTPPPRLSAADRENPNKLSGEALRALGHQRGLSKSEMTSMSDDMIRQQLRHITYRDYEDHGDLAGL